LLPEETWIRISGGSGSLLITGGGGNITIKWKEKKKTATKDWRSFKSEYILL
jgi:hypothetical protein